MKVINHVAACCNVGQKKNIFEEQRKQLNQSQLGGDV